MPNPTICQECLNTSGLYVGILKTAKAWLCPVEWSNLRGQVGIASAAPRNCLRAFAQKLTGTKVEKE